MVPKVFLTYLGKFPWQALIVTHFKSLLFEKFEVTPSVPSHKRFSVFRAFSGAVFLAIEQPNQKTARTCLNQFFILIRLIYDM